MFQKNPVSKYSTFQNIWFMIKLACTSQEKKVLVISFFYRTVNHYTEPS